MHTHTEKVFHLFWFGYNFPQHNRDRLFASLFGAYNRITIWWWKQHTGIFSKAWICGSPCWVQLPTWNRSIRRVSNNSEQVSTSSKLSDYKARIWHIWQTKGLILTLTAWWFVTKQIVSRLVYQLQKSFETDSRRNHKILASTRTSSLQT